MCQQNKIGMANRKLFKLPLKAICARKGSCRVAFVKGILGGRLLPSMWLRLKNGCFPSPKK